MMGAAPLENVGTVCSVFMSAGLALEHINKLIVVVSGEVCLAQNNLSVPIAIPCFGRTFAHKISSEPSIIGRCFRP